MLELDLTGLICPQPVLKTKKFLADKESKTLVKIITTDPDSIVDLQNFCRKTGHILVNQTQENKTIISIIQHR